MSEPVYRIKPLEWKEVRESRKCEPQWESFTPIGRVVVVNHIHLGWSYHFGSEPSRVSTGPDAAKSAAEAWYRERMASGLEEVPS